MTASFLQGELLGAPASRFGMMRIGLFSQSLLLVLLCGCFQVKDELVLQADGSGTVRIETHGSISAKAARALAEARAASGAEMYPPVGEPEAHKLFPGKDFTIEVKQQNAPEEFVSVVTASFKDINALLASPYGQAHSLTLEIRNGVLLVRAVTGAEALAHLTEMTEQSGALGMSAAQAVEAARKKAQMRAEFRLTLPRVLTAANGPREGKTAGWVFEQAKSKGSAEFAQQLGKVLEASCPADGLTINPVTPLRLGMLPFNELAPSAGAQNVEGVKNVQEMADAIRFIPHLLRVSRSRELSGPKGLPDNSRAELFGEIVLPRKFAPQRWGELKLEDVVDGDGNNLLQEPQQSFQITPSAGDDGEQETDGQPKAQTEEVRRTVTLRFKPPHWNVKEITRIKASVALQTLGRSEVVKLPQAIPAKWIIEAKDLGADRADPGEPALRSPKLRELGWIVRFEGGVAQSGVTMLTLQVDGHKTALNQAQVFDSQGRPWPTFLHREDMDDGIRCTLSVAGRPRPPLSLALVGNRLGTSVRVPMLLEHIPITER